MGYGTGLSEDVGEALGRNHSLNQLRLRTGDHEVGGEVHVERIDDGGGLGRLLRRLCILEDTANPHRRQDVFGE